MNPATLLSFIFQNILPAFGAANDYKQRERGFGIQQQHNQSALDMATAARDGTGHYVTGRGNKQTWVQDSAGQPEQIRNIGATETASRQTALDTKNAQVGGALDTYKAAVTGQNSMENRVGRSGADYMKDIGGFSDSYQQQAETIADKRIADVKDMMKVVGQTSNQMLTDNPQFQALNKDKQYFKDEYGNLKTTFLGDIPQSRSDLDKAIKDLSFKGEQDVLKAGDAPAANFTKTKALLSQQLMSGQITPAQYSAAMAQAQTQKETDIGNARAQITASNYNNYTVARLGAEQSFMAHKDNIFNAINTANSNMTTGVTALDAQATSITNNVLSTMQVIGGKAIDQVGAANDILAAANKDAYTVKTNARSGVFDDVVKAINTDGAIAGQIADMTIQNANEDLTYNSDTYTKATSTALAAVDNDKYWTSLGIDIHRNWDITLPQMYDLIQMMGSMNAQWKSMALADQAAGTAAEANKIAAGTGYARAGASLASPFAAAGLEGGIGKLFGGSSGGSTGNAFPG